MIFADKSSNDSVGPLAHRNWQAFNDSKSKKNHMDIVLYSDTILIGPNYEIVGPYYIANLTHGNKYSSREIDGLHPTLHIKLSDHSNADPNFNLFTLDSNGGSIGEELSALIGLDIGMKLKKVEDKSYYYLNKEYPMLPDLKERTFELKRFKYYNCLDLNSAIALVRSARLYQKAIWVSDSEPTVSWLLLVAAVETASNHWHKTKTSHNAIGYFREIKPKWSEEILKKWGKDCEKYIAEKLQETMGSTHKFVNFISNFKPEPPEKRPEADLQFNFCTDLNNAMKIIYQYRSRALHAGLDFPVPMCDIPFILNLELLEIPFGTVEVANRIWTQNEIPMLLRTFEHIVRRVLQLWWDELIANNKDK